MAAFPPLSQLTAGQRTVLDPSSNASTLIERIVYWHGLFSHRRDGTWKGLVAVKMDADDDARALRRLEAA